MCRGGEYFGNNQSNAGIGCGWMSQVQEVSSAMCALLAHSQEAVDPSVAAPVVTAALSEMWTSSAVTASAAAARIREWESVN